MFSSLRMRLTLWYVGAFSAVLILFSLGVFLFVQHILHERLDTNLLSTLQIARAAVGRSMASGPADATSLAEVLEDPRFPGQIVAIVGADRHALGRKPARSAWALRVPTSPLRTSGAPQFYDLPESAPDTDDSCRGVYQVVAGATREPEYFVVVTQSSELLSDQLDALQNVLMVAVAMALSLGGSGGWLLARKGLAPLAAIATTTERITAENLDERLPVTNRGDELGRLASRFNDLLARLSASFSQQRQFMTDASHELRTPLSVMRTAAQVALQKPQRTEAEYREALAIIEQQTSQLTRIVEDMFTLARADLGKIPLEMTNLYLDEVIADVTRTSAVLAQRKGVSLKSQDVQEAPYRGDEGLLRQLISNLLDNAIKYIPEGGTVEVGLRRLSAAYEITVSDTGPGIPVDVQPHIFERFYRADGVRGTNGPFGAGLGLSIARSIAHLHRGELTLQRSDPEGSTFCVSLPLS